MDLTEFLDALLASSSAKVMCVGPESTSLHWLESYLKARLSYEDAHPDVILVEPQSPHASIRVEQIRLLLERLSIRPFYDRYYVLMAATHLSEHCYNALLKTLEEAKNAAFFLCYEHAEGAPITVKSRCQTVVMPGDMEVLASLWDALMALSWSSLLTASEAYANDTPDLNQWLDRVWGEVSLYKKKSCLRGTLSAEAAAHLDAYLDELLGIKELHAKHSSLHLKRGIDQSLIRWLIHRSFI